MNKKIELDIEIYPVSSMIGASYLFLDKIYIYFDFISKNKVEVEINVINKKAENNINYIIGDFLNNILHYTLREKTSNLNKKIRQNLVEKAIYSSIEEKVEMSEIGSVVDDPLGIAVPWEEKYSN